MGIDTSKFQGKSIVLGGSSGGRVKAQIIPMTLKLGKTSRKVDMVVQNDMPTPGLVGQNFLPGLQYEINNQLQVIKLRKIATTKALSGKAVVEKVDSRDRNAVPYTMIGKNILVPVQICGTEVR